MVQPWSPVCPFTIALPQPRRHCIRWGARSPSHEKGHISPPNFRSMSIVAKRLDGSGYHLVWSYTSAQATLLDGDSAPPHGKGHSTSLLLDPVLWPASPQARILPITRIVD